MKNSNTTNATARCTWAAATALLCAAMSWPLLAACSQDDAQGPAAPGASGQLIRLAASVSSQARQTADITRAQGDDEKGQNDEKIVQDSVFADDARIDLYVTDLSNTDVYPMSVAYRPIKASDCTAENGLTTTTTVTAVTSSGEEKAIEAQNLICADNTKALQYGDAPVSITAFYPSGEMWQNAATTADNETAYTLWGSNVFSCKRRQGTAGTWLDYKLSDLMGAQVKSQEPTFDRVHLRFRHMLSRVVVRLDGFNGFSQKNVKRITASCLTRALVDKDALTATAQAGSKGEIYMCGWDNTKWNSQNPSAAAPTYQIDSSPFSDPVGTTPGDVVAGYCILPPQTITANTDFLYIYLGGVSGRSKLVFRPKEDFLMQAGHTYYIVLNASSAIITGYVIDTDSWPGWPAVSNSWNTETSADSGIPNVTKAETPQQYLNYLLGWLEREIQGTGRISEEPDERELKWE